MILAGDVGGTKTALGLYSRETGPGTPLSEEVFASHEFQSLEEIVSLFLLRKNPGPVKAACFAVAGPVLTGKASVTNLSWTVSREALSRVLDSAPVKLINDVEAVACSVPMLSGPEDLLTLSRGLPAENGTIAVIAIGTGLGEAFLTWDGERYVSHPTEGGHADFGPADELQTGLLTFLAGKRNHVSWELVCSGMGVPNIYEYLESTGRYRDTKLPLERTGEGLVSTPDIFNAALETSAPCPLCVETVNTFLSILGAEAGNLALKTMATGGVYLGGGIPPRVLGILGDSPFMAAFLSKGRLTPLMKRIPVHLILNPAAALAGAAIKAIEMS